MNRFLTLLAAATLIAAPAAAQSMRISLAGKSAEQIHADISSAAKTVCARAVAGSSFEREAYASCYKFAVSDAVARAGSPALLAIATTKSVQR